VLRQFASASPSPEGPYEALERLRDKLACPSARDGLRTALLHYAHASAQASSQKGCLISTATGELLPDDEEARARVEAYYGRMIALFAGAVGRAQAEGSVERALDPQALARYLQTLVQGMRFVAKTGADERALRDIVATAMNAI
jgi:TetR/AcrR family transcriptional repressor of nem operon